MFNKYIALSALACAALLPLSAQAQSNSANADVNITLVDPIAVSYTDGSGSMGSIIIPTGGSQTSYFAQLSGIDATATTNTGSNGILVDPTPFDFSVSGGEGLGYSLTTSLSDSDANDGVAFPYSYQYCQDNSGGFSSNNEDFDAPVSGKCFIQSGTTKVRISPFVEIGSGASAMTDGKVATLTVAVAYE